MKKRLEEYRHNRRRSIVGTFSRCTCLLGHFRVQTTLSVRGRNSKLLNLFAINIVIFPPTLDMKAYIKYDDV